MRIVRLLLDQHEKLFAKGTKLEKLYPIHEALDTFMFTPGDTTPGHGPHVRDALDLKRLMSTVVVALAGCILMAMYNTGLQANRAIAEVGAPIESWRTALMQMLNLGFAPSSVVSCFVHGALYFVPVLVVTYAVGGIWEVVFSVVRKHDINEGFLVTGMLFPLICAPTQPLWEVAIAISFGVVIGKEIFGGTGMNILNPALTARAFLFFAYPQDISGNGVWFAGVDGYTSATLLSQAADGGMAALASSTWTWLDAFLGTIPGSMGETSALACLFGAAVLIATQIGSWRTMAGVVVGTVAGALLMNGFARFVENPMFAVPFWWHMVMGGWAFGTVFMATDPVSSAFTNAGKWIYGGLIGLLVILIRVVNPAFPEGMMLAILLMNVFAATIDHYVVRRNIKRRLARNAA